MIVYHYGATDFDLPPTVPLAFARDFVHVLRSAAPEVTRALAAQNPNRSVFKIDQYDGPPDLVCASMSSASAPGLLRDKGLVASSALCILMRSESGADPSLPDFLASGFRAAGRTTDGVLYLRDLPGGRADTALRVRKLAFLCIAFGQATHALQWLDHARHHQQQEATLRTYDRLLRNLMAALNVSAIGPEPLDQFDASPLEEQRLPPGPLAIFRRLQGSAALLGGRIPPYLAVPAMRTREIPARAYWMLPSALRPVAVAVRRAQRAGLSLVRGVPVSASYRAAQAAARMTPLEAQLEAHGFPDLAERMRESRGIRS